MTKNLGNRQAITRTKEVHDVTFEASATVGSTLDLQGISSLAFVFPAEFNGDTITAKSSVSGDTGFTFTAATGRYTPTSDQALALAPDQPRRTSGEAARGQRPQAVLERGRTECPSRRLSRLPKP